VPDTNGKWQLSDYDQALLNRGFDAYQQVERFQFINYGYRYVARKFPWSWEESTQQYTVTPPAFQISTGTGAPLTMSSIIGVDITSDPYRQRLTPERADQFPIAWLPLDMTASQNRGVPFRYYVWQNQIWLLPAPQAAVQVTVYFRKYLADLIALTDTTVLPQIMDEVILDATLVRCHRRAHELQLAQEAQMRVDDAVGDMLQSDVWIMEELQERVIPDNQWL
jgi:hypothetical protein